MIQPNLLQKLAIAGITIFGVGISTMPQKAQAAALGVDSTYGSCGFAAAFATIVFSTDTDGDSSCRPTGVSNPVSATAIAGASGGFQGVTVSASVQPSGSLSGTVADLDVGVGAVPPGFGFADLDDPLVDPIIPVPNISATANIEIATEFDPDLSDIFRITGNGSSNVNAALELALIDSGATNFEEFEAFANTLNTFGSVEAALAEGFLTSSQVLLREREDTLRGAIDFSVQIGGPIVVTDGLVVTTLVHGVTSVSVPEPASILGLLAVGGLGLGLKRKKQS